MFLSAEVYWPDVGDSGYMVHTPGLIKRLASAFSNEVDKTQLVPK